MTQDEIEAAKAAFLAKGDARRPGSAIEAEDAAEREAENRFQRGVEENGYYKS